MNSIKLLFTITFVMAFSHINGQTKISLLPNKMKNYVGKVTPKEFEKVVGKPVLSDCPYFTYEVINTHTNSYTDIKCRYQQNDSILIMVEYPSKEFLGYWEAFEKFPGYSKQKCSQYWEAPDGSVFVLTLTHQNFRCEITKDMFLNYSIKYSILK